MNCGAAALSVYVAGFIALFWAVWHTEAKARAEWHGYAVAAVSVMALAWPLIGPLLMAGWLSRVRKRRAQPERGVAGGKKRKRSAVK